MTDLNYNEIYPNLYQGGEPALELGYIFDYIVFCAEEIQPYEHEFLPAVSLFCPFDDNGVTKPSPSELIEIYETADRVAELVQDGNKVLVTCAAGINRSGLVTALALKPNRIKLPAEFATCESPPSCHPQPV